MIERADMSTHIAQRPNTLDASQEHARGNDSLVAGACLVEVHLRELSQLFDSLDHSPFREKDLDPNAEEYIVESIKELPSRSLCAVVVYLDQPASLPDEAKMIEDAIHVHFARRAQLLRRELRQLLRRGSISLLIGLAFLVTFFLLGQFVRQLMGESQWATLLRESLLIGGWVAMWRPLEIFLYDWWPVVGSRHVHERLSKIKVHVVHTASKPPTAPVARTPVRAPGQQNP
jgi:hypothetical protein